MGSPRRPVDPGHVRARCFADSGSHTSEVFCGVSRLGVRALCLVCIAGCGCLILSWPGQPYAARLGVHTASGWVAGRVAGDSAGLEYAGVGVGLGGEEHAAASGVVPLVGSC